MTLRRSLCSLLLALPAFLPAQTVAPAGKLPGADLKFVVYLSRHGVRSPTGKSAQWNTYSAAPWPTWKVAPGFLTPHGFHLIELFGAYDRMQLAQQGLLDPTGCADAANISIYADSDQRTRETGKALAQGLLPGCPARVTFHPEGTNDPLFHFTSTPPTEAESQLAAAALAGRIGGDPQNLTAAYRSQLEALDHVLATCGKSSAPSAPRTSLLDIPAKLSPGSGDHLVDYKGPLSVASTLSENLLLAYTEGMPATDVGWGCVQGAEVRRFIELHAAATDYTQRTRVTATRQASNLLDHIRQTLEQSVTRQPLPGALAQPADKALFLIGHDTNLENIAGLLDLTWIMDGRRDDTPPGSALILELWQTRATGEFRIKASYTAQTLEQMRESTPLTLANPPARVTLFLPACSQADSTCSWSDFNALLKHVIDPKSVLPGDPAAAPNKTETRTAADSPASRSRSADTPAA